MTYYLVVHTGPAVAPSLARRVEVPSSSMNNVVFVHVSVYSYLCVDIYVYEYDCFMYVHM